MISLKVMWLKNWISRLIQNRKNRKVKLIKILHLDNVRIVDSTKFLHNKEAIRDNIMVQYSDIWGPVAVLSMFIMLVIKSFLVSSL